MSKNTINISQLEIVAKCMLKLQKSGMRENLAIRHLEKLVDVYAKYKAISKVSVDHVDEFSLWSKAALNAKVETPERKPGEYLRVEHGTPRRKFAKMVLNAFTEGKLDEQWMKNHCEVYWRVAVITLEEDRKLNKLRKLDFNSPEERWAYVGIEF